jgi:hypothetical protein
MIFFIIALLAGGAIYFLFSKASKRNEQVRLREEEFLAAARANAPLEKAPVIDPVLVELAMLDTVPALDGAPVKDETLAISRAASSDLYNPKGGCGLCGQPVNAQAIDEAQRAIRLPVSGSDKFAAYHAKCVALRLRQADGLQDKLADVVEAFDALHDDALPAASGQSAEERLQNSVNVARRAIGGTPALVGKEAGVR